MSQFTSSISARSTEQGTISAGVGDRIRPAQAASYATLTPPAWLTPEVCTKVVTLGAAQLTLAQRDELNRLMAHLPKSHIWAKGLCAFLLLASPSTEV